MKEVTEEDFICAVGQNKQRLFLIALSFTKDTYDAEDIIQNVFMKLWTYQGSFVDDVHRDKWLTRVCVNESKNLIKSFFRNHQNIDDVVISAPDIFSDSFSFDVFNAVMELPKKERTVIHLFYYEDLSVKDIARILTASETAVKTRLNRARKKLKELLGDDWTDE